MITVLEKIYITRNCGWCEGKGTLLLAPGHLVSCIVCGGKGHLKIIESAIQCASCDGTGRRSKTRSCLICDGTGWVIART
ncbi:MAG: hypothetical protein NVSMB56_03120 [Pyrinomonadaceae bacterium]